MRAFVERAPGYVAEKTDQETGWIFPVTDEVPTHGHDLMLADVIEAFRAGREPTETFRDGYMVNLNAVPTNGAVGSGGHSVGHSVGHSDRQGSGAGGMSASGGKAMGRSGMQAGAHSVQEPEPKFCSLNDPNCEACQ